MARLGNRGMAKATECTVRRARAATESAAARILMSSVLALSVMAGCTSSNHTATSSVASTATSSGPGTTATTTTAATATTPSTTTATTPTVGADTGSEPQPDFDEWFRAHGSRVATCTQGWEGSGARSAGVDSIDFNRVCNNLRVQYWETMPHLIGADRGTASVSDPAVEAARECLAALSPLERFLEVLKPYDRDAVEQTLTTCEQALAMVRADQPEGLLALTLEVIDGAIAAHAANAFVSTAVSSPFDVNEIIDEVQPELDGLRALLAA